MNLQRAGTSRSERQGRPRYAGVARLVRGGARLLLGLLVALAPGAALAADMGQPSPSTPQITALIAAATNAPLRLVGDDGLERLEYDLVLTNVFPAPVTLDAVEVVGPDGNVLLRLEGDGLEASLQTVFFTGRPPTTQIPVGGTLVTVIDLAVAPGQAPARLTHRISFEVPADATARRAIGSFVTAGPELAVDARPALVIAPPLRGDGWLNGNGCCMAASAHRAVRFAVDGTRYQKPETFAIDWIRIRNGRLYEADGARKEQWFAYGAQVVSVAEGTVVAVRDGQPEEVPREPPAAVHRPEDIGGNEVVVQIRPDVWAMYEHLQPGSIDVRVGDRVAAGQPLGRLGNSGNSDGPHLHFQLSDGPDILTSNSLPYVFDRYVLAGEVDIDAYSAAFSDPSAPAVGVHGTPRAQAGTHPLVLGVVTFP